MRLFSQLRLDAHRFNERSPPAERLAAPARRE
jgi:hypothetical protein